MSELRTDPLTGRQVLIAENRAGRPSDFPRPAAAGGPDDGPRADCPFCPGNENRNPEPTLVERAGDGSWRVRVVPNKYPSVLPPAAVMAGGDGPDECRGAHEVVIETPRHVDRTTRLSEAELADVLRVYAERLDHWRRDGRFAYRLVFKNVGPAAGASLRHLHSQAITLPEPPPLFAEELERLARRHEQTGQPPWGERVNRVLADARRVVGGSNGVVAFCPWASRQPYETWLMPRAPRPWFEELLDNPAELEAAAALLHRVLSFVEQKLAADYNLMVYTAPLVPGADRWFHWRIEVVPRISAIAGFELPTGMFVNTVSPEHAAERLRAAVLQAAT